MIRIIKLKPIILLLALIMLFTFTACGDSQSGDNGETKISGTFSYDSEILSKRAEQNGTVKNAYNNELFYLNMLDFRIADPTMIQITEGEEKGYFYVYGTSDDIGGKGFQGWKSKDLSNWECVGTVLTPDFDKSWATYCYWAPEILYDSAEKRYYLFYNGYNRFNDNVLYLSVAYSDHPAGPFKFFENQYDGNGNMMEVGKPVFDFTVDNPEIAKLVNKGNAFIKQNCLDASPFIDPVTGDKYMYFSYYDTYGIGSFVYGVKMKNWYTPDYSTLTMLTHPGYRSIQSAHAIDQSMVVREGGVNEGPFMVYRNGKYYLTLSVFGYMDPNYRVVQAISDHPLGKKDNPDSPYGDFVKVAGDNGGYLLSTDVANWSHIVSAGHHSFFNCGNETFIAYHTFKNRNDISGGRALGIDKIEWVKNKDGVEVMHTNGPTYSLQPLPESVSGYKNIASSATITANNTATGSSETLLNDGLIKYQEFDLISEYHANEGESVINISWDTFKTVRAVMIYNSYDYYKTFGYITSIEFSVKDASGKTQTIYLNDLDFDWDWHAELEWEFMRPGGASIAEFYEMPVNNIKIYVKTVAGSSALAIGEIVVLGNDSECAGISEFKPYSYS